MTKKKSPKTRPLCIAPFIGVDWRGNRGPDGTYEGFCKPCCDARDKDGISSKVKITQAASWEEIFNNKLSIEVREKLLSGQYHEVCWGCKKLQSQGLKAPPQKYEKILADSGENLVWDVEKGNLSNKLYLLDYRPSNLCNLKCRMCSSSNSSLIAAEENTAEFFYNKTRAASEVAEILPFADLKLLKLAGGEPMIMPETKNCSGKNQT